VLSADTIVGDAIETVLASSAPVRVVRGSDTIGFVDRDAILRTVAGERPAPSAAAQLTAV
jgi:hypothetical protein